MTPLVILLFLLSSCGSPPVKKEIPREKNKRARATRDRLSPKSERERLLEYYRRLRRNKIMSPSRKKDMLGREIHQRKRYFCLAVKPGRFPSNTHCLNHTNNQEAQCTKKHGAHSRGLIRCLKARLQRY